MHLGIDVFWAPAAFEIFCMGTSAIAAAGTATVKAASSAAVYAAGLPTTAIAYLLLVMTMSAIALFLQPSQCTDGVQGQLAAAVTPLAAPRQAISSALRLSRRSPSFQRLLEDPESAERSGAEPVMHGAIAHTPSTVSGAPSCAGSGTL